MWPVVEPVVREGTQYAVERAGLDAVALDEKLTVGRSSSHRIRATDLYPLNPDCRARRFEVGDESPKRGLVSLVLEIRIDLEERRAWKPRVGGPFEPRHRLVHVSEYGVNAGRPGPCLGRRAGRESDTVPAAIPDRGAKAFVERGRVHGSCIRATVRTA